MSSSILIKRGPMPTEDATLKDGELGFDTNTDTLYIGKTTSDTQKNVVTDINISGIASYADAAYTMYEKDISSTTTINIPIDAGSETQPVYFKNGMPEVTAPVDAGKLVDEEYAGLDCGTKYQPVYFLQGLPTGIAKEDLQSFLQIKVGTEAPEEAGLANGDIYFYYTT